MRKRSGTNSPPDPVFFCDENLERVKFPQRLRDADIPVEVHLDHFDQGTPDAEWLPQVGARGWVLLTVDARLRYNRLEQDAIMEHGVAVFVLTGGKTHEEKAGIFLEAHQRILRFLTNHEPPFITKVYAGGRIKQWLSEDDWRNRSPGGSTRRDRSR